MKNKRVTVRRSGALLLSAVLAIGIGRFACSCRTRVPNQSMAATVLFLKEQLVPLDFAAPESASPALTRYRDFYGLNVDGASHTIGTFTSSNATLVAQVFRPQASRATVILMHGYYDHVGVWKHVIHDLVSNGYTVASYDMQGHGLSSGARASIDDFAEYVAAFQQFLALCRTNLPGPYHVVAHSTGAATTIDHMLNHDTDQIAQIILIAPLVRSRAWYTSRVGHSVGRRFAGYWPRAFRKNSSDKEFRRFMKNDPLQYDRVPVAWTDALYAWNDRLQDYPATKRTVWIIQGSADYTVQWRQNLKFLKGKLPNAQITMVKGGGHQLINETPSLRARALATMRANLEGRRGPRD